MITLGFMSLSRQHEADYSAELAKRAPEFGIRFIRFTPFDILPDTLRVKASVYHSASSTWNETEMAIPDYIYDRCFYGKDSHSQKAKPIVEWLKNIRKRNLSGGVFPISGPSFTICSSTL